MKYQNKFVLSRWVHGAVSAFCHLFHILPFDYGRKQKVLFVDGDAN
jgi:hypothetical protein